MGGRGRVRTDRVCMAQSSSLADTAACALPKQSLEEAGDAASFIALEPRLAAYTVLSHCFSSDRRINRVDFILHSWWFLVPMR